MSLSPCVGSMYPPLPLCLLKCRCTRSVVCTLVCGHDHAAQRGVGYSEAETGHWLQAQKTVEDQKAALKDQEAERSIAAQHRGRLSIAQKQLKTLQWEHEVGQLSLGKVSAW